MQAFYKAHADRLTTYQLPSYSPDLNPIEPLWKQTKKRATHLRCSPKFAGLMAKVNEVVTELAAMPAELRELVGVYREWLPLVA